MSYCCCFLYYLKWLFVFPQLLLRYNSHITLYKFKVYSVMILYMHIVQCWRPMFEPWVGKIPWRRERLPTPVERFYEDLQDLLELTPKKRCPFHYRGLECKSRKSRNTWSNRKIWPWNTEWSRAKTNGVLPRKCTGHNKHLPGSSPSWSRVFEGETARRGSGNNCLIKR